MDLLRRPTTGEIMEDGRFSRPYGPGALSHAISDNQLAASPPFPNLLSKEVHALIGLCDLVLRHPELRHNLVESSI
jgi:hypothetical protein